MLQHILVVEDDRPTSDLISQYLGDNHFRVSTAVTGTEAEQALGGDAVDLVILDLNLPDQDGLMLAKKLLAERDIPIVMLTGRSDEMDRVLGLDLGADDYVTKPFPVRGASASASPQAHAGRDPGAGADLASPGSSCVPERAS
jgi:DNA-binding response OmpR family regulator